MSQILPILVMAFEIGNAKNNSCTVKITSVLRAEMVEGVRIEKMVQMIVSGMHESYEQATRYMAF